MKNQKGFTPIIIILVVLIGIGVVYYFGTLNSKPVVESPAPSTVISALPSSGAASRSVTPDSTASWKTYVSTNMYFSLKYPPKYTISEITDLGPNDKRVVFEDNTAEISSFTVSWSPAELPEYPYDQRSTGKYSLQGYDGIYLELPNGYADAGETNPMPQLSIYIDKDSSLYNLNFYGTSSLRNSTVDQILSTFKFIE